MDSVAVTVPLRPPTKKMKKRKELDALAAPHAVTRRNSGKRSSQELLTDSSDDRSEYWSVSTRGGRKCRGSRRSRTCPGLLRACSAFLACASVLATATLIWLFIDVRQQLSALRTELDTVRAGSANVQDILNECHSKSKDLLNNQTTIFTRLNDIKLQVTNFTTQLSNIQHELHDVQESLRAAPELVDVPKKLTSLLGEVGTFGSQIRDLGATVNSMKEANTRIQNVQNNLLQNVTTMEHSLSELSNITLQQPQVVFSNESKVQSELMSSTMSQLTTNLTTVNETLTRKIDWVAADLAKYHKILLSAQDMAINVSTQVSTLEGRCAKHSEQKVLQESISQLVEDVKLTRVKDLEVSQKLKDLEDSYNSLKNSSNTMLASVAELQKSKSNEIVQANNSIQEILGNDNPAGDSSLNSTILRVTAQEELVTGSPGTIKSADIPTDKPALPLATPA